MKSRNILHFCLYLITEIPKNNYENFDALPRKHL